MIILMIISGVIPLIFGLILLFSPSFGLKPSEFLDQVIFILDDLLSPYQLLVGLFLAGIGGWMLYLVLIYPEYVLLHILWAVLIFFGLVYIFRPHWAKDLAKMANKTILSTDNIVINSSRSFGLILIIAGGYIVYQAMLLK